MTAGAEPIRVTRFTTDAFAPDDRHEAWATRDWPTIGPVFGTQPIEPFHNRSERFALGSLNVFVADMGAQRYDRTPHRARADGIDHLAVDIMLAGQSVHDANGRNGILRTGGICLGDLTQPQTHEASNTRTILLTMPRATALGSGLDPRQLHGATIGTREAALLRAHLIAIHGALPDLSVAQGERLGGTVLELLAVALDDAGANAPAAETSRDTATLIAARRLIDAHLGNPALTIAWLCGQLRVARSTLYRLFSPHGGVQAYVRARRLAQVRLTLERSGPAQRLADLAEHWGFSDAAHLSRLFRAQYGINPSDHRERHRANGHD